MGIRSGLTNTAGLEINGEDGGVEAALDVVEPRLLLRGGDGVQAAERKAEQTVKVTLLGEGGGHDLGGLDSLVSNRQAADLNDISVDDAAGRAAITVGDAPLGVGELLGAAALARAVQRLAIDGARASVSAEDPEVRRTRVEVEVERLRRRADLDWGQPLRVKLLGVCGRGALATLGQAQGSSELGRYRASVLQVRLGNLGRTVSPEVGIASLVEGETTRLGSRDSRNGAKDSAEERKSRGSRNHLDKSRTEVGTAKRTGECWEETPSSYGRI